MLNVIVTGGSRGIGLGIAAKLAASGFQVIAVARGATDSLNAAMEAATHDRNGTLCFRPFDLTDISAMPNFVREIRREFGIIYGLVNNAGMGTAGVLANMPDSAIEKLIRLNLVSPITLTKYVVRSMMAGTGGRIVNVSSIVASTGYTGLSVYSATKASFTGFTKSLARELGPLGITVNTIAPGFVATEMTHDLTLQEREKISRRSALRRMAEIPDIANAVNFLMSDNAKNITGTQITIDAGNTA